MIDALTTGVANLDGQGLAEPAKGLVSKLQADVRGLRTDLKQVVGRLQQSLNALSQNMASYVNVVKSQFGIIS
jgi:hypothetical protein